MNKEIRWKQRFQNFEKTIKVLERTADIEPIAEVERAALIHFFEMCFELSWKIMKDYLENNGFVVKSPRATILQAVQSQLIDENNWMDALEDRNLSSRLYSDEEMQNIAENIRKNYLPMFLSLLDFLKTKMNNE